MTDRYKEAIQGARDCVERNKDGGVYLPDLLVVIDSQQAEIEKLTINMNAFGLGMKREKERADTIRTEAIKEYMKILEEKLSQNTDISNVGYQSIIFDMEQGYKEMVGEGK